MFACKVFCFTFVLQTNDTAPDKGVAYTKGAATKRKRLLVLAFITIHLLS
nr:MAG TPA: hypothetical protein [Caudoviricetes sp.]